MKAFEVYQEAKAEHVGQPEELELLRSTYLQKAWADKHCADLKVVDETEREAAAIQWMLEVGEWFRTNILEAETSPETKSRRAYFLDLFDADPAAAVEELDALFRRSRH